MRECVGIGLGLQQHRSIAEVTVGVSERGEHKMQLLPVIGPTPERRGGLDEQHLAVGVFAAVCCGPQLVGEEPQWGVVSGAHPAGIPTGSGWDCDAALR